MEVDNLVCKLLINYRINETLLNKLLSKGIPITYITKLDGEFPSLINGSITKIINGCVFSNDFSNIIFDEIKQNDIDKYNENIKKDFFSYELIDLTVKKICELVYLKEFCDFDLELNKLLKLNKNNNEQIMISDENMNKGLTRDKLFEIVEKICLDKQKNSSYPNDYMFEFDENIILKKFNGEYKYDSCKPCTKYSWYDNINYISFLSKLIFSTGLGIGIGLGIGNGIYGLLKYYKVIFIKID